MKNIVCDVLIIGGGPSGGVTAITAKQTYPDKQVCVIREQEIQLVPCAIPYIFGPTLGSSEKDIASCAQAKISGVTPLLGRVKKIDIEQKSVQADTCTITYDKLIFATGSVPFVHPTLQSACELEGVFTIPKNKSRIDALKNHLRTHNSVMIVGTGFIGIELAMELAASGKEVTIIGGSTHVLKNAFDTELAVEAEQILSDAGITLRSGEYVDAVIDKKGIAIGATLCSGETVHAEAIILATGYQPNSALAKAAGLKLARYGGIWVDEYMRTANKDIFAVGDCSARRDFITKEPSKVMLASTSASEGRVAGSSLYGIKYLKGFTGTIAIFSTLIGQKAFSSAGVTEAEAALAGLDTVTGSFEGFNRHPSTIPDAVKQMVKLVAMRHGGRIIGGQIIGGQETGEMINIIGLMIESKLTIYSLLSLQVATQPMLTAAPTSYPIVMAAAIVANKIEKG